MKILHSSDWHLGHQFYGYDRRKEQEALLRQIERLADERRPDLFVISGDIFHTSSPSASVQKMLYDSLMRMCENNKEMKIVITAGNHDSASRHEIFREPWERLGVYAVGSLNEDASRHIIEIPGKGFVVALPYFNPVNIPDGFLAGLAAEVRSRNSANLPVVLSAHLALAGSDFSGHEDVSAYSVGGLDFMDFDQLDLGFDYIALGHIHKPQTLRRGNVTARYCGSPLSVSFDEDYLHSVSWVELNPGATNPKIEEITIDNPVPLLTIPGRGRLEWEMAKKILKDYPADEEVYIRINIEDSELPPGAHIEAVNLLKDKKAKFCKINLKPKEIIGEGNRGMTFEEFRAKTPVEIALQYAEDSNKELDDELRQMLEDVISSIDMQ